MSQKFKSEIELQALNNATTDTDKILVSDGGVIKYRTGEQVRSDIGAQAALTNPITGTGTTNRLPKFTGATSLGDSQIFDNGTNVGIGNTSPSFKLDVNGVISSTDSIILRATTSIIRTDTNDGSDNKRLTLSSAGDAASTRGAYINMFGNENAIAGKLQLISGNVAGGHIEFYTGATSQRMIITSGGNVGIGTTSPSSILEAREVNRAMNGYGNINVFTTNAFAADIGGSIALGGTSNTASGTSPYPFAKIQGIKEGTGNWSGALLFGTTISNSSISEKMRITSVGNVGIGTTTPSQMLQVTGNGVINDLLIAKRNDVLTSNPFGTIFQTDGNLGGVRPAEGSHLVLQTRSNADRDVIFVTGATPTERMTIKGNGNVGVGTSSPIKRLTVAGELGINYGSSLSFTNGGTGTLTADRALYNYFDGTTDRLQIQPSGNSSGIITFNTNGSAAATRGETMRLTNQGNVGIGTISIASSRFTVAGGALPTQDNGATSALQFSGGVTGRRASSNNVGFIGTYSNASSIEISAGLSGAGLSMHGLSASANANSFICYTNNTERTRITSAGNVGIGTTSPSEKLSVAGNIQSNYTLGTTNTGRYIFGQGEASIDGGGDSILNFGEMWFNTLGSERMRINSTGNVGIGTTSPLAKLHVVGTSSFASNFAYIDVANDFINMGGKNNSGLLLEDGIASFGYSVTGDIRGVRANAIDGVWFENESGNKLGLEPIDNELFANGLIQDETVPDNQTEPIKWIKVYSQEDEAHYFIPVYK